MGEVAVVTVIVGGILFMGTHLWMIHFVSARGGTSRWPYQTNNLGHVVRAFDELWRRDYPGVPWPRPLRIVRRGGLALVAVGLVTLHLTTLPLQ